MLAGSRPWVSCTSAGAVSSGMARKPSGGSAARLTKVTSLPSSTSATCTASVRACPRTKLRLSGGSTVPLSGATCWLHSTSVSCTATVAACRVTTTRLLVGSAVRRPWGLSMRGGRLPIFPERSARSPFAVLFPKEGDVRRLLVVVLVLLLLPAAVVAAAEKQESLDDVWAEMRRRGWTCTVLDTVPSVRVYADSRDLSRLDAGWRDGVSFRPRTGPAPSRRLNAVPPEFECVGMTMFRSRFARKEGAGMHRRPTSPASRG